MVTLKEPARDVPVREEVDVLVCGGGVSGATAALAAARTGASVALVEQYGFLGGANTAAQVNGVGGWQYDLDGRPLISGLPLEIMKRITELGDGSEAVTRLRKPVKKPDYRSGGLGCFWIGTNPECTKLALDRMMAQAGVSVLLQAHAVLPIVENQRVLGAFVESKSGREAILAKTTIDCTGDGDIAARAGAEFAVGRPQDGICQPMTLIFTAGKAHVPPLCYDPDGSDSEPDTDPLQRNRFAGAIRLARKRGEFVLNPNDLFCAATALNSADPDTRAVNFTRVQQCSAIDAGDLTRAQIEGREQVAEALSFMRKYMAGCENACLVSTAPQIGLRESRRVIGDYVLSGEEVRGGAHFPDAIARGIYLLDIHNPSEVGKPSALVLLDEPYSIPYRALLPRGLDNLLVAGRCISGDHIALASYRVQSHCMATGQAAGTAAALAVDQGITPRQLDPSHLQSALRDAGANTGPGARS
jgi:FAD dependent oxidoreductase